MKSSRLDSDRSAMNPGARADRCFPSEQLVRNRADRPLAVLHWISLPSSYSRCFRGLPKIVVRRLRPAVLQRYLYRQQLQQFRARPRNRDRLNRQLSQSHGSHRPGLRRAGDRTVVEGHRHASARRLLPGGQPRSRERRYLPWSATEASEQQISTDCCRVRTEWLRQ